ncbi:hypothetical protein XPU_4655 [Xanthomonas arboricola pv. pruni str. MAFF 311562]|uniref:Uncharacterized protein n=1 Tax=Xanthomonas arboricola pv. pruni str. MAFF 311562 TaxID=1414836 RepID=W4SA98_9XANT|nr:hypothetical protein XPU_4655 [Xanthomonas arboricola pv. pruni str. MAFF 311562]
MPSKPNVSIGGEESAETVAQWQPPPVDLGDEPLTQVRKRADQALKDDRLYRDADDAIPLYLAIQQRADGKDAASRRGLEQARRRLIERGQALIAQTDRQDSALEQARELAIVALALAPQDPKVRALQRAVETAQRVLSFNRAGEEDLRGGRLGEDGNGALVNFRDAAQLDPDNPRTRQGLAAVESGLLARAEQAAEASDFIGARYWLQMAGQVRERAPTIATHVRASSACAVPRSPPCTTPVCTISPRPAASRRLAKHWPRCCASPTLAMRWPAICAGGWNWPPITAAFAPGRYSPTGSRSAGVARR